MLSLHLDQPFLQERQTRPDREAVQKQFQGPPWNQHLIIWHPCLKPVYFRTGIAWHEPSSFNDATLYLSVKHISPVQHTKTDEPEHISKGGKHSASPGTRKTRAATTSLLSVQSEEQQKSFGASVFLREMDVLQAPMTDTEHSSAATHYKMSLACSTFLRSNSLL